MEEALRQYNSLLSSGELLEFFPYLKGNWEQDKKDFITQYKSNQDLLSGNLNIEDEDDEDYSYGFDD